MFSFQTVNIEEYKALNLMRYENVTLFLVCIEADHGLTTHRFVSLCSHNKVVLL